MDCCVCQVSLSVQAGTEISNEEVWNVLEAHLPRRMPLERKKLCRKCFSMYDELCGLHIQLMEIQQAIDQVVEQLKCRGTKCHSYSTRSKGQSEAAAILSDFEEVPTEEMIKSELFLEIKEEPVDINDSIESTEFFDAGDVEVPLEDRLHDSEENSLIEDTREFISNELLYETPETVEIKFTRKRYRVRGHYLYTCDDHPDVPPFKRAHSHAYWHHMPEYFQKQIKNPGPDEFACFKDKCTEENFIDSCDYTYTGKFSANKKKRLRFFRKRVRHVTPEVERVEKGVQTDTSPGDVPDVGVIMSQIHSPRTEAIGFIVADMSTTPKVPRMMGESLNQSSESAEEQSLIFTNNSVQETPS